MGGLKPFGVALGLLGNVMIGLAIWKLIGDGNCSNVTSVTCDGVERYVWMLPVGIIVSVAAIFLGGGGAIFLGVFLAVGIGSLAAGFTTEDSELATFGKLFGAGFVGVPLLMIVLGALAMRGTATKAARAKNLVDTGARGVGTITEVRDTGITINDNPRVDITMSVQPEDGGAAFPLSKTITASRVAIPRAGDRFPVWYDRADASNWVYGTDMDPALAPKEVQELFELAALERSAAVTTDGTADELSKLNELRLKGVLTDEEFAAAKARVLGTT